MSVIYKITNKVNNKMYVGQTSLTTEERFKQHCNDSLKRTFEKRPLYSAMRKYGCENFVIEPLEFCEKEEVSEKEIYWIQKLDTFKNGYNATLGGEGKPKFDHVEIAKALQDYPYPKEIAKQFGCSADLAQDIAKEFNIKVLNKGQENVNSKKSINQYDKNTKEFIQNFESTAEAAKWLYANKKCAQLCSGVRSHISECANGKRKSAYGYIWQYTN